MGSAVEMVTVLASVAVFALLRDALSEEDVNANLDDFYHCVDLSNEQVFLRQQGRIREATWVNWRAGIQTNLGRPSLR